LEEARPLERGFPFTYSKFDLEGLLYVSVRDEEELGQRVMECVKDEVHLIPLSYGTTNFSQLEPRRKPLLYLDVTGLEGVIDEGKDWIETYPGTKVGDLLRYLRKRGRNLPVYPSSFEISSIGGFIEGGSGGPGSFSYGPHFKVLTVEATLVAPSGELRLSGKEVLGVTHAWGTTGLLKRLKVRTVDYIEHRLQYLEAGGVEELRKLLAGLFKYRREVSLVSIYNRQGFERMFREDVTKDWVVVLSSNLDLGSSLNQNEKLSYATSFSLNPGDKWYVKELKLDELEFLEGVKDKGVVHGEVLNLGMPAVMIDVFSRQGLEMRENSNSKVKDHLLKFGGLGREVLREVIDLKTRVDPEDLFNPGKVV